MFGMLLRRRSSGPLPPAGPESGTKGFFTDDRTDNGWSLADLRGTSTVDGTYGRWYSFDGTSNIWKTFGTLGTSFLKIRVGTYANTQYKLSYEGSGGRKVELHAHSFTYVYPYSRDYTITAYVDGVSVWSGTIPGPGDVYDPRSFVTLERLAGVGQFRIIANDVVYHTISDSREFNVMRVWFDRTWNGYGVYGVSEMSWHVE